MEQTTHKPITIGVAGFGYWGPNHVRNMEALAGEGVRVKSVADLDPVRRIRVESMFPFVEPVSDAQTQIDDAEIDAIVVATPVHTHYDLVKRSLLAGKHVLVEKPATTSVSKATELTKMADDLGLTLMVGHTFEFTPAVEFINGLIESGELGNTLYLRSQRVNLGLHQSDINVLWDLAPHDISIILHLLGKMPTHATAIGRAHVTPGVDDIVSLNLEFDGGVMATIILSWLDPRKVRELTIIGSKKMLVYDDTATVEKIRIYDKGVDAAPEYRSYGEFQVSYRYGDITSPPLSNAEPLSVQSKHFIDCVRTGKRPRTDGESALRVVRVLAAAQLSLNRDGLRTEVGDPEAEALDATIRPPSEDHDHEA